MKKKCDMYGNSRDEADEPGRISKSAESADSSDPPTREDESLDLLRKLSQKNKLDESGS